MTSTAPTLYPCVAYRDARAAIDWLERACGFERMMVHPEQGGPVAHAELALDTGVHDDAVLGNSTAPLRRALRHRLPSGCWTFRPPSGDTVSTG